MENTPQATAAAPAPTVETSNEDKTVAILSYLTIIGFIIALILHGQKKTQLGAYHLRQTLGFVVTGFALGVVGIIPLLGLLIIILAMPVMFVFWVMGLVSAVQGKMKPVPLVGEYFQKWFAGTFN